VANLAKIQSFTLEKHINSAMKNLILSLITLLCCADLQAQQPKLSFDVIKKLASRENSDTRLALLVKGDENRIREITINAGGTFKFSRKGISSIMLPVKSVRSLANDPLITRIEDGAPLLQVMSNDTMRYINRIMDVHNGVAPLTQPYTGKNVVVGVIDKGIDIYHPDFQDSTGHTRIKYIWDHLLADSTNTPQPYNYGQEFNSNDIDSGRATAHVLNDIHGTVISGISAGNGRATGEFTGAAPDADIIAVYINFNVSDDQFLSSIADAVEYIYAKAAAMGEPCVINISAGTYYGSHDGMDLSTQLIDADVTAQPGRSLVCAAGNAGGFPLHTHTAVAAGDTSFTWFKNAGAVSYCEFWGDSAAMVNLQFTIAADQPTPTPGFTYRGALPYTNVQQQLGVLHSDTLYSIDGNRLATVLSYADMVAGQYGMYYQVTADTVCNWRIQTTGIGSWDGYTFDWVTSIPGVGTYPPIAAYKMPDVYQNICSGFQCSDKAITVAQYTNMNSYLDYNNTVQSFATTVGALHATSSWGPTRDLRQKPDVAASAEWTFGSLIVSSQPWFIANQPFKIPPTGQHVRGNGTSAASAVVSGMAALYLEKFPTANWDQVKGALINCSYMDNFTGNGLPDYRWGYGKTDAFSMITTCGLSGVEENMLMNGNIYCYPNPADQLTTVQFRSLKRNAVLQLFDDQGRIIFSDNLKAGNSSASLDLSAVSGGLYYVSIQCEDGSMMQGKIVKD
jgi:subtilisin family serine protease